MLNGIFRWDKHGVDILGKVKTDAGLPFGSPLTKSTVKYFTATVGLRRRCR